MTAENNREKKLLYLYMVLNTLKLIYDIIKLCWPQQTNEVYDIDFNKELLANFDQRINIDIGEFVYPEMKNERNMGEFREIIVSIPIQIASYNANYLPNNNYIEDILNLSRLSFCYPVSETRIFVQVAIKDHKEIILFFVYPPYILLLRMFLNEYKNYLISTNLLIWQLEQLLNIIEYINHNNVNDNKLFFIKNNLLIKILHYYGLQEKKLSKIEE